MVVAGEATVLCMTIRGTRRRLGSERDAAERKFDELLSTESHQQGADLQRVVPALHTLRREASFRSAQLQ